MLSRFLSLFTRRVIDVPPPAVLAMLYAMLIIAGASVLKLPFASNGPVSWADAVFTATSAVTVTGLSVVDIGSHFTLFGQVCIPDVEPVLLRHACTSTLRRRGRASPVDGGTARLLLVFTYSLAPATFRLRAFPQQILIGPWLGLVTLR